MTLIENGLQIWWARMTRMPGCRIYTRALKRETGHHHDLLAGRSEDLSGAAVIEITAISFSVHRATVRSFLNCLCRLHPFEKLSASTLDAMT
ncbi:hypothetical protein B2M20_11640 [Nitrobacter vulgaris]|uniref:Uncharacterized protein n=1 Tax=Nitrobacter vulgaris TaxID=29421 RepID=A0A1V4HX07_NITVU|nr:hypothetical protein B2M20_11640 [Nitrobacter vulgaris]